MNRLILYHTTKKTESEGFIRRAVSDFTGRDCGSAEILREELGKPRFADPSLPHFSLSHSGPYTVCAVFSLPCGADVQEHRFRGGTRTKEQLLRMADRFFHPKEAAHLKERSAQSESITAPFFEIWSAKESYVKYTGRGLAEFPAFSTLDPAPYYPAVIKKVPFADHASLWVTAEGDFTVTLKEL